MKYLLLTACAGAAIMWQPAAFAQATDHGAHSRPDRTDRQQEPNSMDQGAPDEIMHRQGRQADSHIAPQGRERANDHAGFGTDAWPNTIDDDNDDDNNDQEKIDRRSSRTDQGHGRKPRPQE